jgi:hypothetical protein
MVAEFPLQAARWCRQSQILVPVWGPNTDKATAERAVECYVAFPQLQMAAVHIIKTKIHYNKLHS